MPFPTFPNENLRLVVVVVVLRKTDITLVVVVAVVVVDWFCSSCGCC